MTLKLGSSLEPFKLIVSFINHPGGCYVTVKRKNNPLTPHHNHALAADLCESLWGQCALPDAKKRFSLTIPGHIPAPWFLPMPPPNITGQLHLGHALFLTLQDIKTRFHGLIGDNTLWLPGTDHAGLATHEKILEELSRSQKDPLHLATYLETGWRWKETHHARITSQIRKMGSSCDWEKERFTLDDEYQSSTKEAFRLLWDQGLITRHEDGQWYAKMETLAAPLIAAIENETIQITPKSSANELLEMLKNIKPWCLSRQIPWGMPIPLKNASGRWLFDADQDTPGEPETDSLDTWFLSSIWPLATLGWPKKTPDWDTFSPAEWMETGDDILFFWCARMLMMGHFLTGSWPFKKLFLHGMIRDEHGRKMSKSLNNGTDPMTLIEESGADALRWHLSLRSDPARDMRFSPTACRNDGKWINKIWQAGRFLSQFEGPKENSSSTAIATEALSQLTIEWYQLIQSDRFPDAARLIQAHFKDYFCRQWIEEHKHQMQSGCEKNLQEGWALYKIYLSLFHPFLPFLTTDLHHRLWGESNTL